MKLRSRRYNIDESSYDESSDSSSISSSSLSVTDSEQTMAYVKKKLSKWSTVGLDITDTGFSKLHAKESKYEDGRKKYNLEPEGFKRYTDNLILKVHRISAVEEFTVNDGTDNCMILKEYSKVTEAQIIVARSLRWPAVDPIFTDQTEVDQFTDQQIKASTVGSYIHEGLTEEAKEQLNADSDKFIVNSEGGQFFDGPSYFHLIATLVDPDNGHLIELAKSDLRELNVKDYNFDVQKMLADFKNLRARVRDLGGTYSADDQLLDLWQCVKTMKEREFTNFVKHLKDQEAMKMKTNRSTVDQLITMLAAKQTRMKSDKEWNVVSPEEAMVMSLVSFIEKKEGKSTSSSKKGKKTDTDTTSTKPEEGKRLTDEEYDARLPAWKKEKPKEGDPATVERNDRKYHWCTKCRRGKGMWSMHQTTEHRGKPPNPKANNSRPQSAQSTKSTTEGSKETEPEIQVRKDLLNNAKAFLAARKDFQDGGTQD